jgi:hypothetical protein
MAHKEQQNFVIEVKNKFNEDCKVAEYKMRGWL